MKAVYLSLTLLVAAPLLVANGPALRSTPDLGKAEGRCRAGESGPALAKRTRRQRASKGLARDL